jgi:hypothetical protein
VDQGSIESSFLTWLMALRMILNMDSLRKGHVMVDWCYMFKSDEEFMDHLLLHCEVTCALKRAFFIRFGLSWVMPRRVVDQCVCWWTGGSTQSVVKWWCLLLFCGVSGGNAIIDVSKTPRGHWQSLCSYFLILCIPGQLHF